MAWLLRQVGIIWHLFVLFAVCFFFYFLLLYLVNYYWITTLFFFDYMTKTAVNGTFIYIYYYLVLRESWFCWSRHNKRRRREIHIYKQDKRERRLRRGPPVFTCVCYFFQCLDKYRPMTKRSLSRVVLGFGHSPHAQLGYRGNYFWKKPIELLLLLSVRVSTVFGVLCCVSIASHYTSPCMLMFACF